MKGDSKGNSTGLIKRFLPTRSVLANLGLLTAGSVIAAYGVNAILVPKQFLSGGALGIALIVHCRVPSLGVGLLYLIVNVPFILLGWFSVGRR